MSEPLLKPGAILSGRWQVQEFLGSGETGEVYGVRDMHGTQTFALKAFWPSALANPELWSSVQQAARTAASLGTEAVARAQDFGIDANSGRPFVVAERIAFPSLVARVKKQGPLTPAEVATALDVIARTLDAAHLTGIVHRDLKPENVFVAPENANWVRVTDFGVSLLRNASPPPPGWGGTPGWIGPDAADPKAKSTVAMDVCSLALVAFFALSGGLLQRAARTAPVDFNALWQEMLLPLDSASQRARELGVAVDPKFDVWFRRALSPDPSGRFNSVGQMASAFLAIASSLVAPESASAVAIPGIAAAIAQPLVFQPETLPPASASAPRAAAAAAQPAVAAPAPAPSPAVDPAPASNSEIPGVPKRSAAPLFIAGAVICFSLTAAGAWLLHHNREAENAATAAASAATSQGAATATATATAEASAPPAASVEAPAASALPDNTAKVTFQCQPEACDWVVCDGEKLNGFENGPLPLKPGNHNCSASKFGFNSKTVKVTTVAGVAQTVEFSLTALPPGIQKLAGATSPPATNKAASPAPAKTGSAAAPKKKCGSVFIPCK